MRKVRVFLRDSRIGSIAIGLLGWFAIAQVIGSVRLPLTDRLQREINSLVLRIHPDSIPPFPHSFEMMPFSLSPFVMLVAILCLVWALTRWLYWEAT